MDGLTLPTCAKRLALELPFTEHCWPFGPEYDVFKVGGKIFMLVTELRGRPLVSPVRAATTACSSTRCAPHPDRTSCPY